MSIFFILFPRNCVTCVYAQGLDVGITPSKRCILFAMRQFLEIYIANEIANHNLPFLEGCILTHPTEYNSMDIQRFTNGHYMARESMGRSLKSLIMRLIYRLFETWILGLQLCCVRLRAALWMVLGVFRSTTRLCLFSRQSLSLHCVDRSVLCGLQQQLNRT